MKPQRSLWFSPLTPFAMAAITVGFGACSSSIREHHDAEEIEECAAYFAKARACFGERAQVAGAAVANASNVMRKSDADRERVRATCSRDLARLDRACPDNVDGARR